MWLLLTMPNFSTISQHIRTSTFRCMTTKRLHQMNIHRELNIDSITYRMYTVRTPSLEHFVRDVKP